MRKGQNQSSFSEIRGLLESARQSAQAGKLQDMLGYCACITKKTNDIDTLLDVGALLSSFGFLSQARECFKQTQSDAKKDFRAAVNLANIERESVNHAASRRIYETLVEAFPNHPVIRRNALVSLEYDPRVNDAERFNQAREWGRWIVRTLDASQKRPRSRPLFGRALRVGYVSSDFCQHTVGLFVKDVLEQQSKSGTQVFAYSGGKVSDWVTSVIKRCCTYKDVSKLSDHSLADLISKDEIDVLVDLSGHTAGSRLAAFAYRPAPVQVSWLGYFATTGLSCIDAVLLDEWHAPAKTEDYFVESIIRMPQGRLCYQPVPFAPPISTLPYEKKGFITFGCFNNTSKLNSAVFDVWAHILQEVPDSKLVLKWRTFNDVNLRKSISEEFVTRGVNPKRIEMRGPSFHADMLNEYNDIDIGLDPFPFSGGMTSCEALWMGVPVVTWPQRRVVSRQTYAFLAAIGLTELAAKDADNYVKIATELASQVEYLKRIRSELRNTISKSPLADLVGFTNHLEKTLKDICKNVEQQQKEKETTKKVLHVGAGHPQNGARIPKFYKEEKWKEIRLDIDPNNSPDILGTMLDMEMVEDRSMDSIYSAHNIEHVYAHEVSKVLKEFFRVLTPDGFLVLACPDLQAVCRLVAEDKLNEVAYRSPAGPISPLDIIYGHRDALAKGHRYMAHKTGFTLKTLTLALQDAGFQSIAGKRMQKAYELCVVATKGSVTEQEIRELAAWALP